MCSNLIQIERFTVLLFLRLSMYMYLLNIYYTKVLSIIAALYRLFAYRYYVHKQIHLFSQHVSINYCMLLNNLERHNTAQVHVPTTVTVNRMFKQKLNYYFPEVTDTVKPLYNSGHPWDVTNWLLYKGGLIIQCTFNREVLFGTLL